MPIFFSRNFASECPYEYIETESTETNYRKQIQTATADGRVRLQKFVEKFVEKITLNCGKNLIRYARMGGLR